ncbi:hypothetical protein HGRIS_007185 [Hohenbuehelia grisea]|uniref:F-box domain-containing protein n=1 Tax=Hohenbuehelia grisea TaxID=104357 RepID=A0ABR3JBF7_9AGAR
MCHMTEEDHLRDSATGCARVILSHVCRRWRSIILSMPILWSIITIRGPKGSSLPRLKEHLERSASCPLSISVNANATIGAVEQNLEPIKDIVALTVLHAQRWKSFELSLSYEYAHSILALLQSTTFPSLENLNVHTQSWERKDSYALFEALTSPGIRTISWCASIGIPPNSCWASLTQITIWNTLSLREVYALFCQCHEIVELGLYNISGHSPLENEAMITVDKLEVFSTFTHEPLHGLFDKLCLPRLKHLALRHVGATSSPDRPCSGIATVLPRWNCALEEFVVREPLMDPEALDQLLRMPNFDSTRDLSIESPSLNDSVLTALTRKADGECILPQLETLSFWRSQSTDGTLGDMVTSRFQGIGPNLKQLWTTFRNGGSRLRDKHALDFLKARGMDIDYEYW